MVGSSEWTKCQYLCNRASNQKTKATLFSQTLKVEENKVCSDFHFVPYSQRYEHIEILPMLPFLGQE